eukprot:scaffold1747_cov251-Pinguiococcus_pyrenoidosus.AAC.13
MAPVAVRLSEQVARWVSSDASETGSLAALFVPNYAIEHFRGLLVIRRSANALNEVGIHVGRVDVHLAKDLAQQTRQSGRSEGHELRHKADQKAF